MQNRRVSKGRGKSWVLWLLALAGLAGVGVAAWARGGSSNQVSKEARTEIELLLGGQEKAWNEGKIDEFLEGYWRSEELTFSGSSGISRGWKGVRERYLKTYPDRKAMGTLDFSELELRALGKDDMLVLGHWHLKRESGEIGGVFTLILERMPEGWKILHDHTSLVAAQTAR